MATFWSRHCRDWRPLWLTASLLSHPLRAGRRLWRYGLGLHLIKGIPVPRSSEIDPKSDHLSFQVGSCLPQAMPLLAAAANGLIDGSASPCMQGSASAVGDRSTLLCDALPGQPACFCYTCRHAPLALNHPPDLFPQADSLDGVQAALRSRGIPFVRQEVVEGGMLVEQLFFHDPDHNMIEVRRAK